MKAERPLKRRRNKLSLIGWFFIMALIAPGQAHSQGQPLADELEKVRVHYGLPAIAAAVVKDGTIVASGVAGVRMHGTAIAATIDDRFHLGSDTKAMTATLAGMLVEEGKLKLTSTIDEVLGARVPGINPKLAAVTLEQLLSHTSGIPSDTEEIAKLYYSTDAFHYNLHPLRLRVLSAWKDHAPETEPGTAFHYANLGYLIAGAMIEKAAGEPWESLITKPNLRAAWVEDSGARPAGDDGEIRRARRTSDCWRWQSRARALG